MHLRARFTTHMSALFLAAGAVFSAIPAHADVIDWTAWTSSGSGSASGTIGSIIVTYSGQTIGLTSIPTWTPVATFIGGEVNNPPLAPSVALTGGTGITETITFSSTIDDPILAIWSLGAIGVSASFDFTAGETFNLLGGGPSTEFDGGPLTQVGQDVFGAEGSGLVQFSGAFNSITFTTPSPEFYYAFTVGFDATKTRCWCPVSPRCT